MEGSFILKKKERKYPHFQLNRLKELFFSQILQRAVFFRINSNKILKIVMVQEMVIYQLI